MFKISYSRDRKTLNSWFHKVDICIFHKGTAEIVLFLLSKFVNENIFEDWDTSMTNVDKIYPCSPPGNWMNTKWIYHSEPNLVTPSTRAQEWDNSEQLCQGTLPLKDDKHILLFELYTNHKSCAECWFNKKNHQSAQLKIKIRVKCIRFWGVFQFTHHSKSSKL